MMSVDERAAAKYLFPFADEMGGDEFCFSLQEKDQGAVYYWSHDTDNAPEYLAPSFTEFISRLKAEES
jgi:hypothetical protein